MKSASLRLRILVPAGVLFAFFLAALVIGVCKFDHWYHATHDQFLTQAAALYPTQNGLASPAVSLYSRSHSVVSAMLHHFVIVMVTVFVAAVAIMLVALHVVLRHAEADLETARRAEMHNRRLASAVEAAANAIVLTDADGVILQVNPAFTTITGYTSSDAQGKTPRVLKSDLQPDAFYAEMWKTIAAAQVWSGRVINKCKDGTLYHAMLTISPIAAENGQITGYVGIQRDVTAEIEHEKEL